MLTTELTLNLICAETVATALKEVQPLDALLHRQLDQAVAYLHAGYAYELRGEQLTCQSQTSPNTYDTTLHACDCPGFVYHGACFHTALLALLLASATVQSVATAVIAQRAAPVYVAPARRPVRDVMRPVKRMTNSEYERACAAAEDCY